MTLAEAIDKLAAEPLIAQPGSQVAGAFTPLVDQALVR